MLPSVEVATYADGRPAAKWRLEARDQGVVLRHGGGPEHCDALGTRDVWVWCHADIYYLHYDGAGPKGWLACLATSRDLVHWTTKGPVLDLGKAGEDDSASASYGVTYFDGRQWHMFYMGTPHVTPAPDFIPAFPYLTMKACARSPEGPWQKQPAVTPFRTRPGTYYSATASPGQVIRHGDEYLMFFSASTDPPIKRTLSIARTKDLNGPWTVASDPIVPPEEQVENTSLFYDDQTKTWFLFTNHVGVEDGLEYTDAIWVYWSLDLTRWNRDHKAVVLDRKNCKWSKHIVGLPSVVRAGNRLAILYDGNASAKMPGGVKSHMARDVGLAWLDLPLIPPADDSDPIFKGHSLPRLRGAMVSPGIAPESLHVLGQDWKANLIRFQLIRSGRAGQTSAPGQYDTWLEGELKRLDALLPLCEKYGLLVVVDLHSPPGGKLTAGGYFGSDRQDTRPTASPTERQRLLCDWFARNQKPGGSPAVDSRVVWEMDRETVARWSAPYRGWHYRPEHVIPAEPRIPGYERFHNTDCPCVYQLPGQTNKWFMSFIAFDGHGYNSFVAESTNLVQWTHPRLAMGFGPPGDFDFGGCVIGAFLYESYDIKAPRLLKRHEGKYWTLYGCYPRQGGYELRPGYEGVACSDDGLAWRRAKNAPILTVQDPDCGAWERDCIYQPWLVEYRGRYCDFYNAANGGTEQTGLAFSTNLLQWTRHSANPVVHNREGGFDAQFASDPKVFRDGDHWTMFYFGVGRGGAHIMATFSRDLVHWTADAEPLYKAGGNPSGLDRQYAHKVSLAYNPKNDTFYLYYCACGNKGRGIGLITSKPL